MAIVLNSRTLAAALAAAAAVAAVVILRHSVAVTTAQVARAQSYERAAAAAANAAPPAGFRSYNQPLTRKRGLVESSSPALSGGDVERERRDQDRNEALYRQLADKMSPEMMARFKALFETKQHALDDALAAARAEGVDPETAGPVIDQMVAEARDRADAEIKAELDAATYAAYQQYERSLGPPDGPPPGDFAGGPPEGGPPGNR